MISSEQLNTLLQGLKESISAQEHNKKGIMKYGQNKEEENNRVKLGASEILAIIGILAGELQVTSVLVDRNQDVQLVLSGSLARKEQSELDKVLEQIGSMPFDEVVKAMVGRLK